MLLTKGPCCHTYHVLFGLFQDLWSQEIFVVIYVMSDLRLYYVITLWPLPSTRFEVNTASVICMKAFLESIDGLELSVLTLILHRKIQIDLSWRIVITSLDDGLKHMVV